MVVDSMLHASSTSLQPEELKASRISCLEQLLVFSANMGAVDG